ncbi:copper amine oxidase N-terminal domain-containing protein [Clostridium formicaceticum]|uniref:Copper amine oxidase-like N-terminal domain-containing protein n=1 Tax=Clostridium formicaceticum TaxID=1497 RepID=A0AAC9RI85_9CLOT|nr:copper amine oxidase N-terminal domain-containing protein [Clostridium formicaceticum]AOY75524.1 hypothetical protein BJL90_06215 [Clostridium formicaceticum]ARE85818.1 hypothetical protein CLFO_01340 [Clostridium formicaceticum]
MAWQKCKMLVSGIFIGALTTLTFNVYANVEDKVTAFLAPYIGFEFNGEEKPLSQGYTVLLYEGRTYTPARFIAEELGAEVFWDEATQTVKIETPLQEDVEKEDIDDKTEEPKKENPVEVEEETKVRKSYESLPATYYDGDIRLKVQTVVIDDEQTRVYISLLNEGNVPIQLEQTATLITIDGKEYKQLDTGRRVPNPYVGDWYNDIRNDEFTDSLVRMPAIPEDTEELTIKFEIRENDRNQNRKEITFNIKL